VLSSRLEEGVFLSLAALGSKLQTWQLMHWQVDLLNVRHAKQQPYFWMDAATSLATHS
jgi:hypothetical protein